MDYSRKDFSVRRNLEQRSSVEKSVFTAEYEVLRTMLRDFRITAGVTQQELAALLDETQSYVSKCERGERRLDLVQLQAFCRALNHPLDGFVVEYLRRSKRVSTHSTSSSRVPKTRATRE